MNQNNIFTYINDLTLRARIQFVLTKHALSVTKEADTVDKHPKRVKLTHRVLNGSIDYVSVLMMILADSAFNNLDNPMDITDAKLEKIIEDIFPSLLFILND
jgi:hypothetical protein